MKLKKISETPILNATVIDNLNSESPIDALSAKQGKKLNEKIDNTKKIEYLNFTSNSNIIDSQFCGVIKMDKIVIVNIMAPLKNLNEWKEYEMLYLPINSEHFSTGVLINQNQILPIDMHIEAGGNIVYVSPRGNMFTREDWFRGQLVFIAKV